MRVDEALDIGGPTFFRNEVFGNAPITMAGAPINMAQATDVASAATVNLDTATGNLVDITGTTTITAITLSQGRTRTVRFTGALTLTHGASLVLPGAANITTAAGDFAIFAGYASGVVRCVSYVKAVAAPYPGITLTSWVAYTPTLTGFGTPSNVDFFWRQVGDTVDIRGSFLSGTNTATSAKVTIPSGKTIDDAKVPDTQANTGLMGIASFSRDSELFSSNTLGMIYDGSDTDELYFTKVGDTGDGWIKMDGNGVNNGCVVTLFASFPVT